MAINSHRSIFESNNRRLEEQFKGERDLVSSGIDQLEHQRIDVERQFNKRAEIARTMEFLQVILERHCSKYEESTDWVCADSAILCAYLFFI